MLEEMQRLRKVRMPLLLLALLLLPLLVLLPPGTAAAGAARPRHAELAGSGATATASMVRPSVLPRPRTALFPYSLLLLSTAPLLQLVTIGTVGGSDLHKQTEQLGPNGETHTNLPCPALVCPCSAGADRL